MVMAKTVKQRKAVKPPPGLPLAVMMEEHLRALLVKNYSEHTAKNHRAYIEQFINWCVDRGVTEPVEVTRPILERYQQYLFYYRQKNGKPLTFGSQHTRLVSLRMWFRWLARQRYILHNPASELDLPRREYRLPKAILTVSEIEQVLSQADINNPVGLRDRALMEVLYSTGMRRMEVAGLKLYDLDMERGIVTIRQGKGKKDRVVPIGERAAAWVEKYIHESRPRIVVEPDDYTLFVSNTGERFDLDYLSELVHEYVKASEIGKRGSCHMFRHTMATLMLENGADIRSIQQILGHASLETTQIYTQVSIRHLKLIHTATHPARL
jgi:integrase/recombinase XerD